MYLSSTNFFNVFRSGWEDNGILRAQYLGLLAETYIFNQLIEKFQYLSFYRKGQEEIDFVASNDYRNLATHSLIEVKYTKAIQRKDIKFIDRTAKKKFKTKYLVYSKRDFKNDGDKLIIPCFLIK
jgi:predicted AAA+ superfamily ATPase